jgi:hypothetical protein
MAIEVSLRRDLTVHGIGSQVDFTGPCHDTLIDEDPVEELTAQPVLEADKETTVRLGLDFINSSSLCIIAHLAPGSTRARAASLRGCSAESRVVDRLSGGFKPPGKAAAGMIARPTAAGKS